METKRRNILIIFSLVIVLIFGFSIFYKPQSGQTFSNIINPSETEPLMSFSCSPLPCQLMGQKTNSAGNPLYKKIYNLSIIQNQINGFSAAGFIANQGDVLEFNFISQDKPSYYF